LLHKIKRNYILRKRSVAQYTLLTIVNSLSILTQTITHQYLKMSHKLQYLDRITVQDIEEAYNFKKNQVKCETITEENLTTRLVRIADSYGNVSWVHVVYVVDIVKPDNTSILEDGIERQLRPRAKLRSQFCRTGRTKLGRVVVNVAFFLIKDYRKKGIGHTVYMLEDKLYRKWGAQEIHLHAVEDGRITWRNLGFVLDCNDVGHVEYLYKEWCRENNKMYIEAKDIKKYPETFLLSGLVKGFDIYKEL